MIMEYHYMKYLPQLNDLFLGGYLDDELVAVMTLGWGVRPRHTIQKLFPSLEVKDYRALGRLCVVEEMPKNTESHFIGKCLSWLDKHGPDIDLVFSWADGVLGKPGLIYQASNFYYGGYIWTDLYVSDEGERVHPRQTNRIGGRPSWDELQDLGWQHYRGKQFRYIYPMCDTDRWQTLRDASGFEWRRGEYPKRQDCEWKVKTADGWIDAPEPDFDPEALTFNQAHGESYEDHKAQTDLESFGTDMRWTRYVPDEPGPKFQLSTRGDTP